MRDHDVARLVVVDGSEVVGVVSRHDVLKVLLRADAEIQSSLNRLLTEQRETGVTAAVEWGIADLTGRMSTRSRVEDLLGRVEAIDGVVGVESDLTWEVDDILPTLPMM
jgi:CBS domain-containing protein